MKRTLIALTLALTSAFVVASTASTANAEPKPAVKDAVVKRIDKRLAALQQYETALAAAKQVQPGHRDTLTKLIAAQRAGLTDLRTKADGAGTARAMVADYRIFALTGPKVRLTAAIDTELAVVDKLRSRPGADTAKLDAVKASLQGKVDALLAVKPGADGDAIKAQVAPVRAAAKAAHAELKGMRKAAK